jgi:hypothetical protein
MTPFDSAAYGSVFGPLLADAPLCELGPGHSDEAIVDRLRNLSVETPFAPARIVDRQMADGCLAGLWLMYDFLDKSHTISQSIENSSGSYWHAIMHRREPDYSNAKYWFRQVGVHPIFPSLNAAAQELAAADLDKSIRPFAGQAKWDSNRFVDLCAAVTAGRTSSELFCRSVQQRECQLLFDYCYHRALRQ